MSNTFFISDTHFGHKGIITFKRNNGKPLRDFTCVEEMDEHIVKCWNSVVKSQDIVYHLGDVVINRRALPIMDRLNGRKVLIKGNHDIFKLTDYTKYFDDIRAYKVLSKHNIICSHIPVHPDSMYRWNLNLHGHLHGGVVKKCKWGFFKVEDARYRCLSVEQISYTPVTFDEILKQMKDK